MFFVRVGATDIFLRAMLVIFCRMRLNPVHNAMNEAALRLNLSKNAQEIREQPGFRL